MGKSYAKLKEIARVRMHLPDDQQTQIVEHYWRARLGSKPVIMSTHCCTASHKGMPKSWPGSLPHWHAASGLKWGPPRAPRSTAMPWTWAPSRAAVERQPKAATLNT